LRSFKNDFSTDKAVAAAMKTREDNSGAESFGDKDRSTKSIAGARLFIARVRPACLSAALKTCLTGLTVPQRRRQETELLLYFWSRKPE
jgi:hypothetical protein